MSTFKKKRARVPLPGPMHVKRGNMWGLVLFTTWTPCRDYCRLFSHWECVLIPIFSVFCCLDLRRHVIGSRHGVWKLGLSSSGLMSGIEKLEVGVGWTGRGDLKTRETNSQQDISPRNFQLCELITLTAYDRKLWFIKDLCDAQGNGKVQ